MNELNLVENIWYDTRIEASDNMKCKIFPEAYKDLPSYRRELTYMIDHIIYDGSNKIIEIILDNWKGNLINNIEVKIITEIAKNLYRKN